MDYRPNTQNPKPTTSVRRVEPEIRGALEAELGKPVVYSNDSNAAAMYAHYAHFGAVAIDRSSVSTVAGTGLGGGVIRLYAMNAGVVP